MNRIADESASRREFLRKTGILITTAAVIYLPAHLAQAKSREKEKEKKGEEVSPQKT